MRNYLLTTLLALACNTVATAQVQLLPIDTLTFRTNSKTLPTATLEQVAVNGQPFRSAYRVATGDATGNEHFTLSYPIDAAVREGDVLLVSFYSRSLQSK